MAELFHCGVKGPRRQLIQRHWAKIFRKDLDTVWAVVAGFPEAVDKSLNIELPFAAQLSVVDRGVMKVQYR